MGPVIKFCQLKLQERWDFSDFRKKFIALNIMHCQIIYVLTTQIELSPVSNGVIHVPVDDWKVNCEHPVGKCTVFYIK